MESLAIGAPIEACLGSVRRGRDDGRDPLRVVMSGLTPVARGATWQLPEPVMGVANDGDHDAGA